MNCATGGQRVDVGLDGNPDGVLQTSEITQTGYVCNGDPGTGAGGGGGAGGSGGATSATCLACAQTQCIQRLRRASAIRRAPCT